MINYFFIIVVVLLALSVMALMVAITKAPNGYEDDDGFHYETEARDSFPRSKILPNTSDENSNHRHGGEKI